MKRTNFLKLIGIGAVGTMLPDSAKAFYNYTPPVKKESIPLKKAPIFDPKAFDNTEVIISDTEYKKYDGVQLKKEDWEFTERGLHNKKEVTFAQGKRNCIISNFAIVNDKGILFSGSLTHPLVINEYVTPVFGMGDLTVTIY